MDGADKGRSASSETRASTANSFYEAAGFLYETSGSTNSLCEALGRCHCKTRSIKFRSTSASSIAGHNHFAFSNQAHRSYSAPGVSTKPVVIDTASTTPCKVSNVATSSKTCSKNQTRRKKAFCRCFQDHGERFHTSKSPANRR